MGKTSGSFRLIDVCYFPESGLFTLNWKGHTGPLSQDFIDEEIGRIAGFFVPALRAAEVRERANAGFSLFCQTFKLSLAETQSCCVSVFPVSCSISSSVERWSVKIKMTVHSHHTEQRCNLISCSGSRIFELMTTIFLAGGNFLLSFTFTLISLMIFDICHLIVTLKILEKIKANCALIHLLLRSVNPNHRWKDWTGTNN